MDENREFISVINMNEAITFIDLPVKMNFDALRSGRFSPRNSQLMVVLSFFFFLFLFCSKISDNSLPDDSFPNNALGGGILVFQRAN